MAIVKTIGGCVLISVLFVGEYFFTYTVFDRCLSDDVDFHFGKTRMRNRAKSSRGFGKSFSLSI